MKKNTIAIIVYMSFGFAKDEKNIIITISGIIINKFAISEIKVLTVFP